MSKRADKRLSDLERAVNPESDEIIVVLVWGDEPDQVVSVNGEQMTYAEYQRRYPDSIKVGWPDEDDHKVVRTVGFDLGKL